MTTPTVTPDPESRCTRCQRTAPDYDHLDFVDWLVDDSTTPARLTCWDCQTLDELAAFGQLVQQAPREDKP